MHTKKTKGIASTLITELPLISGYFNRVDHSHRRGYIEDPAVAYVKAENTKKRDENGRETQTDKSQYAQESNPETTTGTRSSNGPV